MLSKVPSDDRKSARKKLNAQKKLHKKQYSFLDKLDTINIYRIIKQFSNQLDTEKKHHHRDFTKHREV